jgi:hypothetical protein
MVCFGSLSETQAPVGFSAPLVVWLGKVKGEAYTRSKIDRNDLEFTQEHVNVEWLFLIVLGPAVSGAECGW